MSKATPLKVALAAFTLTTALSATGALAETPSWCGPNEASLALLDGFGGNSWRLVTTASGAEEAAKCPSITQYEYADGQGNTQKAISDINSMAARGIQVSAVGGPLANSSRPSRLGLPLFSISTLWSSERVTGSVTATSPVRVISPKLCTRLAFSPVRREFPGLPDAPRMP